MAWTLFGGGREGDDDELLAQRVPHEKLNFS